VAEVPAPSHKTKEEREIALLNTSYPTMRVSSDGEKRQTHHRMSAIHESTYQEDVKKTTGHFVSYDTSSI
jgi:hypothetical protein